MPRCARFRLGTRVMSRSNSRIEPLSGESSPVIRLNSVVLPAPLGPMISRRSPGSMARLTLVVTCKPPNDLHRRIDGERGHGFASGMAGAAPAFCRLNARHAVRDSRAVPGTRPSGMKMTMATKIAPSMKFQRTM